MAWSGTFWVHIEGYRIWIYQCRGLCWLWERICNIPEGEELVETRSKALGAVGSAQKSPVQCEIHEMDERAQHWGLLLSPHCTHIIQPLDDVPYAALKKRYQKELITYNFKIAGAHMTRSQFFRVLVPAFTQAFIPENIRKGFENTGIYPINPKAKKVQELGPSAVTDKCKSIVEVGHWMLYHYVSFRYLLAVEIDFL